MIPGQGTGIPHAVRKQNVIYLHNGMLLGNNKKLSTETCDNMGEP